MRQVIFICKICKGLFVSKHGCKSRTPLFCSIRCYGKSLAKFKKCPNCEKEFYNYKNKFCSMRCFRRFRTGKPFSDAHKKALSEAKLGKYKNEASPNWKGDKVSYYGLHLWVHRELGCPMRCEHCKKLFKSNRQIHWANKSGKYLRVKTDWIRLCVSCHKKYDILKTKQKNKSNEVGNPVDGFVGQETENQ